jgi:hypothetical protein
MSTRLVRTDASAIASASATVAEKGFSQRTCFPASSARMVQRA